MSSRRQHPGEQPDPVRSPSASSAVYESAEESVDLESWASGSLGRPRSALSGFPTPRDTGLASPVAANTPARTSLFGASLAAAAAAAQQDSAASPATTPPLTSRSSPSPRYSAERGQADTAVDIAAGTAAEAAGVEVAQLDSESSASTAHSATAAGAAAAGAAAAAPDAGREEEEVDTLSSPPSSPPMAAGADIAAAGTMGDAQLSRSTSGSTPAASPPQPGGKQLSPGQQQEQQQAEQQQQQQQGAVSSSANGSGSSSSMFSVPMAHAPATGIFSIPEEAFRIKDLDTGREYALDKRYWIKDMDTGTVYVLESEGTAASAGGARTTPQKVTELLSGRELNLNEFEEALGYFREPEPVPGPVERHAAAAAAAAGAAAAAQLAQKGIKSINAGATWVKQGMTSVIHRVKAQGTAAGLVGGPTTPRPGGGAGGEELGGEAGSGPGSVVGDERHGVPVKVYRKSFKEFTDLRVVQRLAGHQGVVWTMKFSRNGKYLASAGQDCTIQVWEVLPNRAGSHPSSPSAAAGGLEADTAAGGEGAVGGEGSSAAGVGAIFGSKPYRTYTGHKQDVLDLCWSKTQFLLSASMDKTVRLWHITMDECLRVFKHTDFVTAIDFHPSDDKMFLSGSIDGKVRLWNIPEQRVVSWQDVHEMVTAVSYAPPDGRKAVVGTMKGKCRFYSITNNALEYEAQLDVKNKRGQHARGKKVTGLQFLPTEPGKLLITSNDSRIRLYDGYTMRCKFKGHSNRNTQIRASISPQAEFITCGSDDGWVYIWSTRKSSVPAGTSPPRSAADENPFAKEKNASYECFQANGDIVTVAVFAPESTHRPLGTISPSAASRAGTAGPGDALGGPEVVTNADSLGDRPEGEAALAAGRARGQVILTAGYSGEVTVFCNLGLPQWL